MKSLDEELELYEFSRYHMDAEGQADDGDSQRS